MASPKDDRLQNHTRPYVAGPSRELPLQIAAKNDLLAESRAHRQQHKHTEFRQRFWVHRLRRLDSAESQHKMSKGKQADDRNPEKQRNGHIDQEIPAVLPLAADNLPQCYSVQHQSQKPDVSQQYELIGQREQVGPNAADLSRFLRQDLRPIQGRNPYDKDQ